MAHNGLKQVRNWHDALIDTMIQSPEFSGQQLADLFGVTQQWISLVKNSDAFKERLAQRRDEHFGFVSASVIDKVEALAELGVDTLAAKVEAEGADMSVDALHNVTQLALKSLGFGNTSRPTGDVNTQNVTVIAGDRTALADARELLRVTRERHLDPQVEATRPAITSPDQPPADMTLIEEVADSEPTLPPAA